MLRRIGDKFGLDDLLGRIGADEALRPVDMLGQFQHSADQRPLVVIAVLRMDVEHVRRDLGLAADSNHLLHIALLTVDVSALALLKAADQLVRPLVALVGMGVLLVLLQLADQLALDFGIAVFRMLMAVALLLITDQRAVDDKAALVMGVESDLLQRAAQHAVRVEAVLRVAVQGKARVARPLRRLIAADEDLLRCRLCHAILPQPVGHAQHRQQRCRRKGK